MQVEHTVATSGRDVGVYEGVQLVILRHEAAAVDANERLENVFLLFVFLEKTCQDSDFVPPSNLNQPILLWLFDVKTEWPRGGALIAEGKDKDMNDAYNSNCIRIKAIDFDAIHKRMQYTPLGAWSLRNQLG